MLFTPFKMHALHWVVVSVDMKIA